MSTDPRVAFRGWFERQKYAMLLATLLLVYALHPVQASFPALHVALQVALVLAMAAALAAFWRHRAVLHTAAALGLLAVGLQVAREAGASAPFGSAGLVARAAFALVIVVAVLGGVARAERVTMNDVYGVCAVYMMMGLAWSQAYVAIEQSAPGSFRRPELDPGWAASDPASALDNDMLYFSLITMATVGYGDISPVSPTARTLSALQGLIGQLFLAIFLARMVSLEVSHRMAAKSGPHDG